MKRRTLVILAIAIFAIGVSIFMIRRGQARTADEAALNEQLRLARAEGIPTTWQEYASQIQPTRREDNAALLYISIPDISFDALGQIAQATRALSYPHQHAAEVAAQQILTRYAKSLAVLDTGTKLPRCLFEIRWGTNGDINKHSMQLGYASRLLELRGSLAAVSGRQTDAIKDAAEILDLAKQIADQGDMLAITRADGAQRTVASLLATWSLEHRDTDAYAKTLKHLVDHWLPVDIRQATRDDLLRVFDIARLSTTPAGRKDLGLDENKLPPTESISPLLLNRTNARADIARAERKIWGALPLAYGERKTALTSDILTIEKALAAYPSGLVTYMELVQPSPDSWMFDIRSNAYRVMFEAAYRALSQKVIPKSIKTDDLLSPFDDKPLTYSLDGKQIVITADDPDVDSGSLSLKIPRSTVPVSSKTP